MNIMHHGYDMPEDIANAVLVPLINENMGPGRRSKKKFNAELTKRLQQRGIVLPDLLVSGDVLICKDTDQLDGFRVVSSIEGDTVYMVAVDDPNIMPGFDLSEHSVVGFCMKSILNKDFSFDYEHSTSSVR